MCSGQDGLIYLLCIYLHRRIPRAGRPPQRRDRKPSRSTTSSSEDDLCDLYSDLIDLSDFRTMEDDLCDLYSDLIGLSDFRTMVIFTVESHLSDL